MWGVAAVDDVFKYGNQDRIWQKYCGFLDLNVKEFLDIQEQLLLEQLDLACLSPLGRQIMPGRPRSVAEFRKTVPFTAYADYAPYFLEKDGTVLAFKPTDWARTSGRGGAPKWVPCSKDYLETNSSLVVTAAVLSAADFRGDVKVRNGIKVLHNLPPSPYAVNYYARGTDRYLDVNFIPDLASYDSQSFETRMKAGFEEALATGADVLASLSSVLVKMGKHFEGSSGALKFNLRMLHPRVAARLLVAQLRSKQEKRVILPKDLWPLKGLICYGMDTSMYKAELVRYWGREPLEIYAATETGLMAVQAWNKRGMTFTPQSVFFEFIPEEDFLRSRDDKTFVPRTVLLDRVEPGKRYEVVITSFYGMPFLRYRIGDLVKFTGREDTETGIKLPQMVFESRGDGLIDIAGFARLDEKIVWQAIAGTGIKYEDWCVRKEYRNERPIAHLYIELEEETSADEVRERIDEKLIALSSDYADLQSMLGIRPLEVTLLAPGSFDRYYQSKQAQGADLAHLKPPHVNANDRTIEQLTELVS